MMVGTNSGVDAVIPYIRRGSVGVEIGVWRGDSAAKFLNCAGSLHLVDPWSVEPYEQGGEFPDYESYRKRYTELVGSPDPIRFSEFYEVVYQSVQKRFRARPVTVHRCTSAEFFRDFKQAVDWVYIDGLHSFDACSGDLEGALRIVKHGGFILGDDYGMPHHRRLAGVTQAVDRFIAEHRLKLDVLRFHQYAIQV